MSARVTSLYACAGIGSGLNPRYYNDELCAPVQFVSFVGFVSDIGSWLAGVGRESRDTSYSVWSMNCPCPKRDLGCLFMYIIF